MSTKIAESKEKIRKTSFWLGGITLVMGCQNLARLLLFPSNVINYFVLISFRVVKELYINNLIVRHLTQLRWYSPLHAR